MNKMAGAGVPGAEQAFVSAGDEISLLVINRPTLESTETIVVFRASTSQRTAPAAEPGR